MPEPKHDNRPPMGGRPGRPGPGPGGPMMGMMGHKEKPKNAKATIRRLLGYLADNRGLILLVFFMTLIYSLVSIVATRINGIILDNYVELGDAAGLVKICAILAIVYVLGIICHYLQTFFMVDIAQRTCAGMRRALFTAMQKLPLQYFDTHSSGDLMSRLSNDIDSISTAISSTVPELFSGIITIIGTLIAMLILSPLLTLIAVLLLPLTVLAAKLIIKKTQPYFGRQQKELGELNGYIEEYVSGQKAVTLFGQEEQVRERFGEINDRLSHTAIYAQSLSGTMGPVNNMIHHFDYLVIAVCAGYLMLSGIGHLTYGSIFSFLNYVNNFGRPVNAILSLANAIQLSLAAAERVFAVMDEKPETDAPGSVALEQIRGQVIAKDVCFSYEPGKPVLKHADFHVEPGQTYAIVGPTGAGKTTIISLLTRFYDLDSGSLTIDGQDILHVTRESLRRNIGMVLQDTYLFSESIRENIRYGRPDATDEQVIHAAELANADHFIRLLPEGYDTVLTDNGANLSQGQRQLLAIARALLAEPQILILDEATSSIDTRTELAAQKAMLTLMEGRTSFVIAHRLSTIRGADCILVLRDGEIVERGTHDALISAGGFYADLYNSQFKTGMAL